MPQPDPRRIIGTLCLTGAVVSLVLAVLYNEFVLARFDPNPPLARQTIDAIRSSQLHMLVTGVLLLLLAELVYPRWLKSAIERRLVRPAAVNVAVVLLVVVLPLALAEWMLQPIVRRTTQKTTSLFVKDDVLGWRLRPNSEELWGGVRVVINAKGVRGPEVDYRRTPGTRRVLYLGDSVTFGYRLASYKSSYPYQVESILEQTRRIEVETINAGVGGYSPWQYLRYLESEGVQYEPDLVVVGFVLNDVTEKLNLKRFGGTGVGRQLSQSYFSLHERLKHNSGIYGTMVRIATRLRLGGDPQAAATAHEQMQVEDLARSPQRDDVRKAWGLTIESLTRIANFCKDKNLPLVIVAFPYTFQFEDPAGLSAPQETLATFARNRGIPCLDLLPLLSEYAGDHSLSPTDIFSDHGHLTTTGGQIVAEMFVTFVDGLPGISDNWQTGGAER